ncbi:MAG: purine-nucleoside phosphorylase [Thermoanaerobaculales bacterium]|nr:purine-nucleoside phosphorylase [Thermoanaerobaculales bacterium]
MNEPLTPASLKNLAAKFRKKHSPDKVRALLVAGSGLTLEVPGWTASETLNMGDIMPFPIHHLMGHDHTLTLWRRGDETILVMNGRFHLYQGYTPAEVVAPIRLAALLGAEVLLATNATGALDPKIPPGSLVVINDHINFQASNPLVGSWGPEMGPQFPDMSQAYDPELRALAVEAASRAGFKVFEGVYAAVFGPSFETPAEVRMLATLGGTVVGMSTVSEVLAARHMGLKVLVLSLASNPAAGLKDQPLTHQEVLEVGAKTADSMRSLLGDLVGRMF